jgi:hypothetical protein
MMAPKVSLWWVVYFLKEKIPKLDTRIRNFVCLFCCESHEQFFSYLATVTITGDKTANLYVCLALTAFSSEGSFTCHTYCDTGTPFLRLYPKDPWFSLLNAVLLSKEQSHTLRILNVIYNLKRIYLWLAWEAWGFSSGVVVPVADGEGWIHLCCRLNSHGWGMVSGWSFLLVKVKM